MQDADDGTFSMHAMAGERGGEQSTCRRKASSLMSG